MGLGTFLTAGGNLFLKPSLVDEVRLLVIELGGVALILRDVLFVFADEFGHVGGRVILRRFAHAEVGLGQAQFLSLDKLGVGR